MSTMDAAQAVSRSGKGLFAPTTSSGFTLIEVLLAMSIVFLVAMATFQGYRTAQDSATRSTHALLSVGERQTLLSHIRVSLNEGYQQGSVAVRGRRFQWQSEAGEPRQIVLGFDPQTLRPELSGQRVIQYRVHLHLGEDRIDFLILGSPQERTGTAGDPGAARPRGIQRSLSPSAPAGGGGAPSNSIPCPGFEC